MARLDLLTFDWTNSLDMVAQLAGVNFNWTVCIYRALPEHRKIHLNAYGQEVIHNFRVHRRCMVDGFR